MTRSTRPRMPRVALLATAVLASLASASADEPASTAVQTASASSQHTLFMGVELAVQRDDLVLPVRDVQGSSLIAKRKGKEIRIPTTGKSLNMRVSHSLKVTTHTATIQKMNVERAYTAANDPFKKFAAQAGAASGADAVASLAQGELTTAILNYNYSAVAESYGYGQDMAAATAAVNSASQDLSSALLSSQSPFLNTGTTANTLAGDEAKEAFDALVVAFDVSTPKPLAQAYVVVLAQLRAGEATKAVRYNWVYAKALGEVDERPHPVYIKQGGFPPGYVIERCEVHLFNLGEEIATNVSPMRVELTKEEAFQYAALDYVAQHKGATLPAGLAGGQNTESLRVHLDQNYRGGPVFVEVLKDGLVGRVFKDKDGEQPLEDAPLLAIVRELRFNPALSIGKPVDSMVKVKASPDSA